MSFLKISHAIIVKRIDTPSNLVILFDFWIPNLSPNGIKGFSFYVWSFIVYFYVHQILAIAKPAAVLTSNREGILIWRLRSCEHISTHPRSPLSQTKAEWGRGTGTNNTWQVYTAREDQFTVRQQSFRNVADGHRCSHFWRQKYCDLLLLFWLHRTMLELNNVFA